MMIFRLVGLGVVGLLAGCVGAETSTTDAGDVDTGSNDDTDQIVDSDEPAVETATAISGTATWAVEFDADALALGAFNCSYTRAYEGLEDRSSPWLCPTCEKMFRSTVQLTGEDCYNQVTTAEVPEVEWTGYAATADTAGDAESYFRTSFENYRLSPQGVVTITPTGFELRNETEWYERTGGGTFRFVVTGSFDEREVEENAYRGFAPPETYTCGWPQSDTPMSLGKGPIEIGQELPDGLFRDACGEGVRLHDFAGNYIVIDVSAMNCGPCRAMAEQHAVFENAMTALGIDAVVVTLLAPALDNVLGQTSQTQLEDWINTYELNPQCSLIAGTDIGYWETIWATISAIPHGRWSRRT